MVYTNWSSANTDFSIWSYGKSNVNFYRVDAADAYSKCLEWCAQAILKKNLPTASTWKKMGAAPLDKVSSKYILTGTGLVAYMF